MSSIQKTATGYRVQIAIKGQRDSQTFATKREAQQWAALREIDLRAPKGTAKTLGETFRRYADEVSPTHKGWRHEHLRIAVFERMLPVKLPLSAITPEHIAQWRDDRLRTVSAGAVLRDISLLSAVFEVARREWRWIETNPVKIIRKPSAPEHRARLITWREIKAVLRALEHHPGQPPKSITQALALCFLAALRTGMRGGELAGLTWGKHYGNYVRLDTTKTGVARDVPLSIKSRRIFERVRGFDSVLCFGMSSQTRDTLFRRARDRAGLSGFTFHDSRHCAATWLGRSGKVEMLEMCKIFGWTDTKHALIYFNPSVTDLANKLD